MAYNYNFGHNRGNLARDSLPLFSAWEASSKIIFHGILPFSLHSEWASRENEKIQDFLGEGVEVDIS